VTVDAVGSKASVVASDLTTHCERGLARRIVAPTRVASLVTVVASVSAAYSISTVSPRPLVTDAISRGGGRALGRRWIVRFGPEVHATRSASPSPSRST
jgi:hypothetical protein